MSKERVNYLHLKEGACNMAGPDHRDYLIISVLHSIPQNRNGEAHGFTFASTHLIQGPVDLDPHTQRTKHGQSFPRSSWNCFCQACGFVSHPQWRNATEAVFSPSRRVPFMVQPTVLGYSVLTSSSPYLKHDYGSHCYEIIPVEEEFLIPRR